MCFGKEGCIMIGLSGIWHSSCFLPMAGLGVGVRHCGQGSRMESLMAEVGF